MSFRLALLMIVEMALWHREGMSSMFGVSGSWRMVVACVVLVFEVYVGGLGVCWLCCCFILGDAVISVVS